MLFRKYPQWINKNKILNLRKERGTLKGDIGELIVKNKIPYCHRTREMSPDYLNRIKFRIPANIKDYLKRNWYTIDLFSFIVENDEINALNVYEVKMRNFYSDESKKKFPRPKITSNSLEAYEEALKLGIKVTYIEIILFDNWEYYLFSKEFNPSDFTISNGTPEYSIKK